MANKGGSWFHAIVDYSDVNRTIGDMRKYSAKTYSRIEKAVDASVRAISRRGKRNAPRGRTGALRNSIRSMLMERNKYGPEGWSFVKGGKHGAPHAHLIERGAKASVARPRPKGKGGKQAMTILNRGAFIGPFSIRNFAMSARIPARRPRPFLGPAYEAEKQNTINRIKAAIAGTAKS